MKSESKSPVITFPKKLLEPVSDFLKSEMRLLKARRKSIKEEDPFQNLGRVTDNASPDTDAEEQFGHARTSAINEELDIKIRQIKKALSRIKIGKYGVCANCGDMIDTDRLMIYPEATLCVKCEAKKEKK